MQYFSTNRKAARATFREAALKGQPDDRGLYFPEKIPALSREFWKDFPEKSKAQIAFEVIKPYVGAEIDDETLFGICAETVDFDFPLVSITEKISALELFHGPTLAFKDVGARFMSRCLRYFLRESEQKTIIIVATSGDTGGAVASGFYNVENTEVVILYPKGKVSRLQELQLTTLGGNIHALEVAGNFDDCQSLAKNALADEELKRKVFLTSANSINVARWLPQQFYYFYAFQSWIPDSDGISDSRFQIPNSKTQNPNSDLLNKKSTSPESSYNLESGIWNLKSNSSNLESFSKSGIWNLESGIPVPVVCVPSGNFGNICAGILAHVSGLPCEKFIAATNANDVIPQFLESGEMKIKSSVPTLSNAMDVANPSNFVRILEIFDRDYLSLKEKMESVSVSDAATAAAMREVYEKHGYVLDPHGAVGFYALREYLEKNPGKKGFFLETAHPVKFDSVEQIVGTYGNIPETIENLYAKTKQTVEIQADYAELKEFLSGKS